ncbi:MAG TPA: M3 family metallopeptidase [Candidatus Dormibacteraeota bacterium]|jgi:thimet oligopeptidase|nr:M3 family metallopeptidase [Candidatus Dormibacteraeota bacterium]
MTMLCFSKRLMAQVLLAVAICGAPIAANAQSTSMTVAQAPVWASKPDIAAFEKIENDRLAAGQRAIDQILAVKGGHTIENTLVPYDEVTRQYNTAGYMAGLLFQVHPDAKFRDSAATMTSKVGAAGSSLSLNQGVYKALAAIDLTGADPATRYYVQRQLLEFKLAGVDKDDATRDRLKKLFDKLTDLQTAYDRNISDDQRSITVDSAADLEGMPKDFIEAHKPGADGKIKISTNYPDAFPIFTFAKSDAVRKKLFIEFDNRAYPKNREVLMDMVRTRYEIASIVGYSSWADFNAADRMIGNAKNIADFIQQVDSAARPVAQREYTMLLAEKQKVQPGAKEVADYENYSLREQVRRTQFNFDSTSVRPYLPYERVKKGVLDTAAKLFSISFQQEQRVPAWDPTVETWDVFDQGKMIGRLYLDMHPREGKFSHAEMVPVLDGIRGKQLPEAVLVCNFPVPTAEDPGLMDYNDVVTFFHEFGHLMHWMLSAQQWAGISGISMESDFGEAPSEMLEEWMHSPQVLATFAKHYKTNEPIPAELVARMNRADAFGRASWVTRQNVFTATSFDLYNRKPEDVDPDKIVLDDERKYSMFAPTPGIHDYASFGHLAGYSSAYYTYLWDKVIAEDFVTKFDRKDLLAPGPAARYRRLVLEPGGSKSANDLVKDFLGRPQNMDALKHWMSEQFEATPAD